MSRQKCDLLTHFFLLPHSTPASISCSTRGNSAVVFHSWGCCEACRMSARTSAELLTVQPRVSVASWLSCPKARCVLWVRLWVRIRNGCFVTFGLRDAMSRVINSFYQRARLPRSAQHRNEEK
jgi:hypothetical protein